MSKEYVLYTGEGYTESPSGARVENFQILGFEYGDNGEDALEFLLKNNMWITENGFDKDSIKWKKVIG